jgi:hypothetical protein
MALNGCATIPNTIVCTAAGTLTAGAICAETLTNKTSEMSLDAYITFLEAQEESPGQPARAGAMCQSSEDWNKQKTVLEQLCRHMGPRCTYEIKQVLTNFVTAEKLLAARRK